jgi:hypothetical protein
MQLQDGFMTTSPDFDWNDAYENGAYIENAQSYPERWADEALDFRSGWIKKDIDIIYGDTDRQRLDLFHSEDKSKGLVVFVHGGYWRRFDKSYWSHLARGRFEAVGLSVCPAMNWRQTSVSRRLRHRSARHSTRPRDGSKVQSVCQATLLAAILSAA